MIGSSASEQSVCIPTGMDSKSYSCVRSLSRQGINTIIASNRDEVTAGASRFCDENTPIPSPDEDILAYRDALLGIAARPDVQTIIPVRSHDPHLFATYEDQFADYVSLITPSSGLLSTVNDRMKLTEAASTAGVAVPETRLLTDVTDWRSERIIKSRYNLLTEAAIDSFGPREVAVVKTVKHLQPGNTPDVDGIVEEMNHVPIVQEYIRM